MPAFVSTVCISIVFVPMFFLSGVARYLFVPLAEAVVFALFASYFFSRTIIPTLVMFLLPKELEAHRHPVTGKPMGRFARIHERFELAFESLQAKYTALLAQCLEHRRMFLSCFLIFCLSSLLLIPWLGQDFFPAVDAGQFLLHVRAKTGTRIEETARRRGRGRSLHPQRRYPANELAGILDNIGVPTSGINLSYNNTGTIGNADADILVSLQPNHHPTADYVARSARGASKALSRDFILL